MIRTGKIKIYHQNRGFGFIEEDISDKDIFFHISDFPNKNILPKIGEKLTFEIGQDNGKIKAVNIVRLDYSNQPDKYNLIPERIVSRSNRKKNQNKVQSKNIFFIVPIIFISIVIFSVYERIQRSRLASQPVSITTEDYIPEQQVINNPINKPVTTENYVNDQQVSNYANNFKCDGRTHCSQMNSREEANWFVANCPGTKMDGNNDGEACERDSRW